MYISIYIYIYIEREREIDIDIDIRSGLPHRGAGLPLETTTVNASASTIRIYK